MSDNPFSPDNSDRKLKSDSLDYMQDNLDKSTKNLQGIAFLAVVALGALTKFIKDKISKRSENNLNLNKSNSEQNQNTSENFENIGNKLSNKIRNMFSKNQEVAAEKDSPPEFVQRAKGNQPVWQNAQQLQNFRQNHQKNNLQSDREKSLERLELTKTEKKGGAQMLSENDDMSVKTPLQKLDSKAEKITTETTKEISVESSPENSNFNSVSKTILPETIMPEDQNKAAISPGAIAPKAKNSQKENEQNNQYGDWTIAGTPQVPRHQEDKDSGLNTITKALDALIHNNKDNKQIVDQAKKLKLTLKQSEQNNKPQKGNFNPNQAAGNMIRLFKRETEDDKSLETQNYTITRRGKEYTMSDKLGNTLLVAKDNGSFGTGVKENNLTPSAKNDLKYVGEDLDQKKPSTGGFERKIEKEVLKKGAKAAGTAYGGIIGGMAAEKVTDKVGDKLLDKVEGKIQEKKVNRFEKELQELNANANTLNQTGKTKTSNIEMN